jgi:hypothetical protein
VEEIALMRANLYHPMCCNWAKRVLFQADHIARRIACARERGRTG